MANLPKRSHTLPRSARGFTYVLLLFAVAILGVGMAGAAQVWTTAAKRSREQELLYIGGEFSRALQSYRDAAGDGTQSFPARLEDLLEDRRKNVLLRHLRKIYVDPVTRKAEWGTVLRDGRVVGVYSLAKGKPLTTLLPDYVSVGTTPGVVSDDGRSVTLPAGLVPPALAGMKPPPLPAGASGGAAPQQQKQANDYRDWVFVPQEAQRVSGQGAARPQAGNALGAVPAGAAQPGALPAESSVFAPPAMTPTDAQANPQ